MKRRDFLRNAGATALIPVLPVPAAAVPAAAAPVNAYQFGWAALFARVNDRATPELLQKWLRIDAVQADALMSDLVSKNVLQSPVGGSAVAVNPMYPSGKPAGFLKKAKPLADKTKQALDALFDEEDEGKPRVLADSEAHDIETEDQTDETS